jgi:N6-L-threonylcarbamoyladenine synthase
VLILSIESSCDESSAAVLQDEHLLAVKTRTQTVHEPFGGVVPELAGRSHLELIDAVVRETLKQSAVALHDLDLVAATAGPGLVGSLLVGVNYARGIAAALGKRFRAVHHLEAHLWSAALTAGELPLPFLVLLVSGGHTLLIQVDGLRRYRVLGSTVDDALGEAYDKVGKLMNLPFPAGAHVDRLAAVGNAEQFLFPIPMNDPSCNMSFSGLKTAVAYRIRAMAADEIAANKSDLLASFQQAALASVMLKLRRAASVSLPRALVAAGGVSANSQLRLQIQKLADELGISCFVPELQFCGDNAAMIGYLAWRLEHGGFPEAVERAVHPRWPLNALISESSAA